MSLILEQKLNNGDVVRYHRIAEYDLDLTTRVVTVVLHSFRNLEHRSLPVIPVCKREFAFLLAGEIADIPESAYQYIKSLPEWGAVVDV